MFVQILLYMGLTKPVETSLSPLKQMGALLGLLCLGTWPSISSICGNKDQKVQMCLRPLLYGGLQCPSRPFRGYAEPMCVGASWIPIWGLLEALPCISRKVKMCICVNVYTELLRDLRVFVEILLYGDILKHILGLHKTTPISKKKT